MSLDFIKKKKKVLQDSRVGGDYGLWRQPGLSVLAWALSNSGKMVGNSAFSFLIYKWNEIISTLTVVDVMEIKTMSST